MQFTVIIIISMFNLRIFFHFCILNCFYSQCWVTTKLNASQKKTKKTVSLRCAFSIVVILFTT